MKKYSRKHVYDKDGNLLPIKDRTYITNEGYICIVVDGGYKAGGITCQIGSYTFESKFKEVKQGKIKNPFHLSKHNKGYFGVGKYKAHSRAYTVWDNIFKRVYPIRQIKLPHAYKDVEVCEEWLNFQNFADWFYNVSNYKEGWQLDKDLLSVDKKIYSPKTCIFVPQALNSFMTNIKVNNTSGAIGVYWHKRDKKWRAHIRKDGNEQYLGNFDDIEDASNAYIKARKEQVKIWKSRMKGLLPDNVISKIK